MSVLSDDEFTLFMGLDLDTSDISLTATGHDNADLYEYPILQAAT